MCTWWRVFDEPHYTFVCSDQRLDVGAALIVCAPDGELSDEVWEDLAVI